MTEWNVTSELMFILLVYAVSFQIVQSSYPAVLDSIGVGYNILTGNPDGTDWRHGGEDPGLLVTRRILKLESETASLPDQLVYTRHDSCQSSATDHLIYSAKTYQQHLGERVSFAGTSLPDLEGSAFTLSSGYVTVKKETETLHYVLQDTASTCVNGTARYTLNLASVNYYHLTNEFMSDLCSLPEVFDTDTYTHFLDRWGTGNYNDNWITKRLHRNCAPKDEELAMPVVWPSGKAGLPKSKGGCPVPSNDWLEGWLKQNTETQTPDSNWNATHLDGTLTKTSYLLKFCIKPNPDEFSMEWPPGDYCIFKYEHCPSGFSEGFVQWDDEDTNNMNAHGGVLPDGVYGKDTRINYCCRSDGHTYTPIVLPTETPFYLFRYKHGCQAVHGMTSSLEYLFWDDDDTKSTTSAAIGAVHPGMVFCNPPKYPGCGTKSTIYYCYYNKAAQIPSIIG